MKQKKRNVNKNNMASKKKNQPVINIKSVLAILLILLLIGTAIAPVFSETVPMGQDLPYNRLLESRKMLSSTISVNVENSDQEASFDDYYKDFIEFMVDYAEVIYYKD